MRMADQGGGHRQRLKERFLRGDVAADQDPALLELLLTFSIPRVDVQPQTARLLERFGSLDAVLAADAGALRRVDGIGDQATLLLKLVDYLARRRGAASPANHWQAAVAAHADAEEGTTGGVNEAGAAVSAADVLAANVAAEKGATDGMTAVGAADTCAANVAVEVGTADGVVASRIATLELPPGDAHAPQSELAPPEYAPSPTRTEETAVEATTAGAATALAAAKRGPPRRPRGTLLFSGVILGEAIALLPEMPPAETSAEARAFFREHLRFNAAETRDRFASFIVQRMFPEGVIDRALPRFARVFAGRQELRDVCFYRLCKAEPIMSMVAEQVLLPAIAQFEIPRSALVAYLRGLYPASRSIDDGAAVIVRALADAQIARVTPKILTVAYRPVALPALAFVLSSEFPPGVHAIGELSRNPALRALLWDPSMLVPALYELRNQGWISRVSEIDSVRQFTTQLTPDQLVERLTGPGRAE